MLDPVTVAQVIGEIGEYLNKQYQQWDTRRWESDITTRLVRIEEQLNTLTSQVNDLFGYVPVVVALQAIYDQNGFLASQRAQLENIIKNHKKHDDHGWPIANKAEKATVAAIQNSATNAAGIFMNTGLYGFSAFMSVFNAATIETTAMLVSGMRRDVTAGRFDYYIAYFRSALGEAQNSLPTIRNGLRSVVETTAQPMDTYPKSGSIGTSKPGVADPEYVPDTFPPTSPRVSWSIFQILGSKDAGFSEGPVTHTFEWQTPDKILPCRPPITFGRETFDVERTAMVVQYLNSQRPPYIRAKQHFDGAELQIGLAQKMLDQLLAFQRSLRSLDYRKPQDPALAEPGDNS